MFDFVTTFVAPDARQPEVLPGSMDACHAASHALQSNPAIANPNTQQQYLTIHTKAADVAAVRAVSLQNAPPFDTLVPRYSGLTERTPARPAAEHRRRTRQRPRRLNPASESFAPPHLHFAIPKQYPVIPNAVRNLLLVPSEKQISRFARNDGWCASCRA